MGISNMATAGVVTSLLLLLTVPTPGQQRFSTEEIEDERLVQPSINDPLSSPTEIRNTNDDTDKDQASEFPIFSTPTNLTIPDKPQYQQTQEETRSARIQLEKIIENQRLANIKYQEIQLEQLRKAEAQLKNQIENQKQLQLTCLQTSNRSQEIETRSSNEEENLKTKVVEEESKKMKSEEIEDGSSQTTKSKDSTNHWKAEEKNSIESVKASSKLVVPDEVKAAVEKVSIHLVDQMSKNFTVPEYVLSAVRGL